MKLEQLLISTDRQTLINHVAARLAAQGCCCLRNGEGFLYIHEDGRRDAIGHMLSDEGLAWLRSQGLMNRGIYSIMLCLEEPPKKDFIDFLDDLRRTHDAALTRHLLAYYLESLALHHGLEAKMIRDVMPMEWRTTRSWYQAA